MLPGNIFIYIKDICCMRSLTFDYSLNYIRATIQDKPVVDFELLLDIVLSCNFLYCRVNLTYYRGDGYRFAESIQCNFH